MKKILIILAVLIITMSVLIMSAYGSRSVDAGGETTDPDYYCRVLVEGAVFGDNLQLTTFECRQEAYPLALIPALWQIGGDTIVKCNFNLNSGSVSSSTTLGDIGSTQEKWYTFKITNVPQGYTNIMVTCQGESTTATASHQIVR